MSYKVGDKVRVREDLIPNISYGSQYFVSSMGKLKGKISEIYKVITKGEYYLTNGENYKFTDDMLEPIGNEYEFKVGDRVICTEDYYRAKDVYGTVVKIKREAKDCIVKFDRNVGGWSDKEFDIPSGRGLYIDIKNLKLINSEPQEYKEDEREENKMINCDKILNIYKDRVRDKIEDERKEKIEEIETKDPVKMLTESFENELNVLLDRDENNRIKVDYDYLYTEETKKQIKEVEEKYSFKIEELNKLIGEVVAVLEPVNDYDKAMEILKEYGILDKKGKINA